MSAWSSPRRNRLAAVAVAAVAAAASLTSCSSSSSDSAKDPLAGSKASGDTVVVGSNNYAESILLGDIYGEALKAKGIKVTYKPSIGSRETTYGLLKNGTLTVLPEFNGALLAYLDAKAAPTTEAATDAAVTGKLDPKLTLLKPAAAQDKDSITVNAATASKYHLTSNSTIADLAPVGKDITIGASPEFQTRQQGLVGLKSVYGLTPKSFKALDAGGALTEAALKNGNVQAADIFTTDPTITKEKFVVLQDPKNLFGFENVVPLVYKTGLSQAGADALNAVSAKLDTATLLDLDAQVQSDSKDPLVVAKAWLTSVGLV
ncbi:osmoprotectant transport system substrate-binding protein [Streptomyces sp. DvalAA-14]|uniref:ABC transporter substrate-binding protein n=1 Tax=unclassified Streptomyces TaxID=2593676 RepID=UPI00081BA12D|nr:MULTISPECIES: ABC transporter substrate-binding protein [unclassified Streptomyces]MYS21627.1 glycine/betaine ABC transporter substrate-binding protein [Streptomyces sp. SID4948]SCD97208.1 osmoprotectant transport system substrate-binding protein [Streptomyces sp. DvalAA-14]